MFFFLVCFHYSSTICTIAEEYPGFSLDWKTWKYLGNMRYIICISTFLLWDMELKVIERPGKETILGHSVWLVMATSLRELYTRSLLGLKLVLLKVTLAWSVSWRSGCCSKCLGWLAFRLGLGCGCELWFCLWLWYYPQSFFLIWVEFICVLKERKIIVKKRKSMFGIILYWFSMFLVIIYFYK